MLKISASAMPRRVQCGFVASSNDDKVGFALCIFISSACPLRLALSISAASVRDGAQGMPKRVKSIGPNGRNFGDRNVSIQWRIANHSSHALLEAIHRPCVPSGRVSLAMIDVGNELISTNCMKQIMHLNKAYF
jgi:hypothetical protein